jgi:seryl-tRNA synthetase
MNRKLIIIILVVVTVVSIITAVMSIIDHRSYVKQQSLYEQELREQFKKRIDKSEKELGRSKLQRDSLITIANTLSDSYEDLLLIDKKKTVELNKIKGAFKDLTTEQLENKMIEAYNKAND